MSALRCAHVNELGISKGGIIESSDLGRLAMIARWPWFFNLYACRRTTDAKDAQRIQPEFVPALAACKQSASSSELDSLPEELDLRSVLWFRENTNRTGACSEIDDFVGNE